MWRRAYLVLLITRLLFAVSPSYLHPDEFFQGPEVIAGEIYGYPVVRTWEWTVKTPIRSVFPLWLVYGPPMTLLKAFGTRNGVAPVSSTAIYYVCRLLMFILSFVLEDWAIHELIDAPKRRKEIMVLVASSYVTWVFQSHTFSNSIETLLVLWSLVLMQRIAYANTRTESEKPASNSQSMTRRSYITANLVLGLLLVLGVFNRITFPAYLVIPGLQLLPHLWNRPLAAVALSFSALFWTAVAIITDTAFYCGSDAATSFSDLFEFVKTAPIITPINNLMYNTKTSNLAAHGLHPRYQHIFANLPQLLGPALVLLIVNIRQVRVSWLLHNQQIASAAGGLAVLSVFPHQEARFLLPCVPLLLSQIRLPSGQRWRKRFWLSWITFNVVLGTLMGVYHQGGIVPAQLSIPQLVRLTSSDNVEVYWWKTYPPPTYLLGLQPLVNGVNGQPLNIVTIPLLGLPQADVIDRITAPLSACGSNNTALDKPTSSISDYPRSDVYLAAPLSAWHDTLDLSTIVVPLLAGSYAFTNTANSSAGDIVLHTEKVIGTHLNLDDMDWAEDGVLATLKRVVGRRGLGIWSVERICR